MKAILLLAGEGKRLRPFSENLPKCLVKINQKPLIDYQIEVLKSQGVSEIIMVSGYCSDKLKRYHATHLVNGKYESTNMLYTLFCAKDFLENEVIISYGDIIYSPKILKALIQSNKDINISVDLNWHSYWSLRNNDPLSDAETLKYAKDFTILEIGQKPKSIIDVQAQYMGLIKLNNTGCNIFKEEYSRLESLFKKNHKFLENLYLTDFLQHIIKIGHKVTGVPVSDNWIEIDTVSDLNSPYSSIRLQEIVNDLKNEL